MNIRRNTKEIVKELKQFFNIYKEYDCDMRGYFFKEIKYRLMENEECIIDLVESTIEYLYEEVNENCCNDDNEIIESEYYDMVSYHITGFKSLNLDLLKKWQDNLIEITNVDNNYCVEYASIRTIK